jgi:hypothetical protein
VIDRRIDYLTLVVERPLTKNIMIPGFDEDGLPANTTLMTLDVLGHEFFIAMGEQFSVDRPFPTSSIEYFRTENKTIYWRPFPNRAELQFKGKFFLQPDWKAKLQTAVNFLMSKNVSFNGSRVDLNYKFFYDGKFEEDLIFKSQFGKLRVRPELHQGNWGRVFGGHSRFQLSGYNKTRQLKETKEDNDPEYIKLFLEALGLTEMPKDRPLYNLDLRLTPKKKDGVITNLLKKAVIDFEAIEEAILSEAKKKIYLPKQIRDVLKIKDWRNPFKKKLKKPKPKRRAKK